MKELRRIQVGEFYIKEAIKIDEFKTKIENNDLSNIITIEEIFKESTRVNLEEQNIKEYLNGCKIEIKNAPIAKIENVCRVYFNGKFIGLGTEKNGTIKRDLVLNVK